MKVAIVGSNSFFAQYVIRELVNNQIEPSLYGIVPSIEFPILQFTSFKFPDTPLVQESLLHFDAIIYTAGAGVQANLKEPVDLVYELNSFTPIRLANFLAQNQYTGKFITFGSYFEIGNEPNEHYYIEEEIVLSSNAVPNHYCTSKRILTRYFSTCPYLPLFYHFILPNIYGKDEHPDRLIPYIITALKNNKEIKLTSGEQIRQYIHVIDIAKIVLNVIHSNYPKGIYNLCRKEPIKIKDLVYEIFSLLEKSHLYTLDLFGTNKRTDTAMPYLLMDNTKVTTLFDYTPNISISEGIKLYL